MNNAHAAKAVFSHRHNADHTVDSICHTCFRTIAKEASEAALKQHEVRHNCVRFVQSATLLTDNTPCASNGTTG